MRPNWPRLPRARALPSWQFAGPGRLRGHISRGHDPFATFRFKRAASELLSAEIDLFSDEVRRNDHLTSDLITASPL